MTETSLEYEILYLSFIRVSVDTKNPKVKCPRNTSQLSTGERRAGTDYRGVKLYGETARGRPRPAAAARRRRPRGGRGSHADAPARYTPRRYALYTTALTL